MQTQTKKAIFFFLNIGRSWTTGFGWGASGRFPHFFLHTHPRWFFGVQTRDAVAELLRLPGWGAEGGGCILFFENAR